MLVVGSHVNYDSFICHPGKTRLLPTVEAEEDNSIDGNNSTPAEPVAKASSATLKKRSQKPKDIPVYDTSIIKEVQGNIVNLMLNNGESYNVKFFFCLRSV